MRVSLLTILLIAAGWLFLKAGAAAQGNGFLQRKGTQLLLDGKPLRLGVGEQV